MWGVDTVKVFCPCCRELYEPTDVDAHYIRASRRRCLGVVGSV